MTKSPKGFYSNTSALDGEHFSILSYSRSMYYIKRIGLLFTKKNSSTPWFRAKWNIEDFTSIRLTIFRDQLVDVNSSVGFCFYTFHPTAVDKHIETDNLSIAKLLYNSPISEDKKMFLAMKWGHEQLYLNAGLGYKVQDFYKPR